LLSAPQKPRLSVCHTCTGRAAGCFVIGIDTEPGLNHHIAIVVFIFAVLICGEKGREKKLKKTVLEQQITNTLYHVKSLELVFTCSLSAQNRLVMQIS